MKRLLLVLITFLLLAIGIFYYISNQQLAFNQPLIPQEDEEALMEETEPETEDQTEETEGEENSFTEQLTLAVRETIDRVFQRETKIVAIGDSLTRGVGDRSVGGGYVGILERTLNQERQMATFKNFGVPGNRSEQLLARLNQPEIKEALQEADIILMTIGANDIMKVTRENLTHLVIEEFIEERSLYEERLETILGTMQEYNEDAEIYLLGIYNPFEKYFQEIEELNQIVDAWNDTGSDLAEEMENVTFIPIFDLFSGNEEPVFAEDNFHPNYTGYYLMAERVLDYISREEG